MTAAASIRPRRGSGLLALAAALLWAAPLNAQKADTVILRNGDRIVGELKALDRGAVSYLTDDMGTLAIQWDKIDRLISDRYFEVEVGSGEDRKSTRLNPSHVAISYAVFCLKKKSRPEDSSRGEDQSRNGHSDSRRG